MPTLTIDPRYCGPPRSGNGGYCCGVLGRLFPGPASVRLHAPPPLGSALVLEDGDDGLRLRDGDTLVARARAASLDLLPPTAPSLAAARQAARDYIGFAAHPFPTCFVCGPAREEGDGLRIFPGRVAGQDLVAAPWTPAENLADASGEVEPEFVWAALDCTGFFAFAPLPDGAPAVLGELTAHQLAPVRAGEPVIAAGWLLGSEGRKRFAGSALYAADGRVLALARAIWLVMPPGAAGALNGGG